MRIFGHMVVRNEMDRWLTTTLPYLMDLCHGEVAVYDDQSTDGTLQYVLDVGAHARSRPEAIESFAENEGVFRWAAWQYMERRLGVRAGDWVISVDADELLVVNEGGGDLDLVRMRLLESIGEAEAAGERTITFNVAEVFAFDGMGWPLVRTDGYWGDITACRAARWETQGIFESRKEGGGSLPTGWPRATRADDHLELMHLGYARAEDRVAKYARYRLGAGHNPRHIQSIITQPKLEHWIGMRPPLR